MAVVAEQRLAWSQSGLIVPSGSGESMRRRVPASEEHAEEHRSSVEKVRLPSLANELDRFRREGTVSPARRILASISCARWRTRPGFPRMLRMLSLLELRVSVEPCGDETGVSAPESSTASGTDVQKSAGVPNIPDEVSIDAEGRFGVSAGPCVAVPACSRKRSWNKPESFSSLSARRLTRPDLCSWSSVSCCCCELPSLGRPGDLASALSLPVEASFPLTTCSNAVSFVCWRSVFCDWLPDLSLCTEGGIAEAMHESEAGLLHLVHLQFGPQGHSRVGVMALTATLVQAGTSAEILGTPQRGKWARPCSLALETVLGVVKELDTGLGLDACFLRVLSYTERPDNTTLLKKRF